MDRLGDAQGKLGVFWHTQGAGKSFSMLFLSQKVLRKKPGNWTFVVITDRIEFDDQIYGTFLDAGAVRAEDEVHAKSGDHLKQLLTEDHRVVFTLIHKFKNEPGKPYPVLSQRSDIIVMTDEAHRTQYAALAMNMRRALPNASFIAFTGTPLIGVEERTREVFGDYISVYDFQRSIEEGATVPLYYENRVPEMQLINDSFNEELEALLEEAMLDDAQEKRLEREFAREYYLITDDDRLDRIAADIVDHFMGRYQAAGEMAGKAMVVSVDKATTVRMYDKVQRHWQRRITDLETRLKVERNSPLPALGEGLGVRAYDELAFMRETDMAVVVSQAQNEVADFAEKGLDIRPHRKRIIR
jgi:type I restriction enzyme R subunit